MKWHRLRVKGICKITRRDGNVMKHGWLCCMDLKSYPRRVWLWNEENGKKEVWWNGNMLLQVDCRISMLLFCYGRDDFRLFEKWWWMEGFEMELDDYSAYNRIKEWKKKWNWWYLKGNGEDLIKRSVLCFWNVFVFVMSWSLYL